MISKQAGLDKKRIFSNKETQDVTPVKARSRQNMFQQPAFSAKKGDRDDMIQMTTGADEQTHATPVGIVEQTSLQKKVYSHQAAGAQQRRGTLPIKSSIGKPLSKFGAVDSPLDHVIVTPDQKRHPVGGTAMRQTGEPSRTAQPSARTKPNEKSAKKPLVKYVLHGKDSASRNSSRNHQHYRNLSLDPQFSRLLLNGTGDAIDMD